MISFIIPAKNEEDYIADCLSSVVSQASGQPYEIIVVNNASTDGTSQVVAEKFPQVKIVTESQIGTSAARQRGFVESKGEILIFLDADVRLPDSKWLKRALEKIFPPAVVAVSSHYKYYGLSWHLKLLQTLGTFLFVYPWIFLIHNLLGIGIHVVGGLMLIKKPALLKAGGFDTSSEFFGDEALLAKRLYRQGRVVVSPQLWALTSGRRFKNQGLGLAVYRYVMNYFWTLFTGHPYNQGKYKEIR